MAKASAKVMATTAPPGMTIETVPIDSIRPHPRNPRSHPPDQLDHLETSLRDYGWAKNVVVASDHVILAGHGIVEAARRSGHTSVPVHRLDIPSTDPKAEKFMVLDNTVTRLAEDDDAQLAELLADIQRTEGLVGTGYDDGALEDLLGNLDERAWGGGEAVVIQTGADLARKWFVGFVLHEAHKVALGVALEADGRLGEKPHETLARLVVDRVVAKT